MLLPTQNWSVTPQSHVSKQNTFSTSWGEDSPSKVISRFAGGLLILTVTWTDSLWSKIYQLTSNDLVIPTRPKKVFYYEESLSWKNPLSPRRISPNQFGLKKPRQKDPCVLQRGSFFILRRCGDLRLLWYCRGLSGYRSLTIQSVNEKNHPKLQWGLGPPKGSCDTVDG